MLVGMLVWSFMIAAVEVDAAVNPIELGRSSNIFGVLQTNQNQVVASDALHMVAFLHQQDVTIWGGGSTDNSKLRYDLSIDSGNIFSHDIGSLNTSFRYRNAYPNLSLSNGPGNINPFNSKLVWAASTNSSFPFDPNLPVTWVGHVTGASELTTTSPPSSTEIYRFDAELTTIASSLCNGKQGEFWYTEFQGSGISSTDSVVIYRGTYNASTTDIDWVSHHSVSPAYNTAVDATKHYLSPNIAFSPAGTTGWAAWLGDLAGGQDGTLNPILMKSTDGGATWGRPVEVDFSTIVYEGSQATLTDFLKHRNLLFSSGIATSTYEADLTVDANGAPHFVMVVGNVRTGRLGKSYEIFESQEKVLLDVTTNDGGATWIAKEIAEIRTLKGEFGTMDSNGNLISQYNYSQVSRSEDGMRIFYSWVDSDTIDYGGINSAPNLFIAGLRISDGVMAAPKNITGGDPRWDGKALYPTMAPTVLTSGTSYTLPVVSAEMVYNDQWQPTRYWYFGNDAVISESDFCTGDGCNAKKNLLLMIVPVINATNNK